MPRSRHRSPLPPQPNAPADSSPPLLLDLGARAAGWLGPSALAPYRVITVEPPVGDRFRRPEEPRRGRTVRALPDRLPFADGAFAAVVVASVLEHARDDLDALDEVVRVLGPGGVLVLRTPRAGPLTWLDPYNLYRYAADTSGRGPLLVESGELGWRRHYRRDELATLLTERGLVPTGAGGAGFGLSEAIVLLVLLLCRIVLHSERAENVARRALRPLLRAEANLPAGRFAYDLVVRAERSGLLPKT